jgi:hypothetical protein
VPVVVSSEPEAPKFFTFVGLALLVLAIIWVMLADNVCESTATAGGAIENIRTIAVTNVMIVRTFFIKLRPLNCIFPV